MEFSNFDRLYDVFLSGPLYIYLSTFISNTKPILKIFVFLTGLATIIYNGHNWLFLNTYWLQMPLFPNFVDLKNGKTQPHRIFNLLVMYPVLVWSNYITKKPTWLTNLIYTIITLGFLFNLYNYNTILNSDDKFGN